MQDSKSQLPFQRSGNRLKTYRERRRESLAEVCGAVEIDIEALERIEQGRERPSEDVLMLLINHFGLQETEAIQLWESAGYAQRNHDERPPQGNFGDMHSRPTMVLLAIDARVLYTDGISINRNKRGIIMNFSQAAGQDKPLPVARVGMSYEQAEEVLKTLQRTLLQHKYLPEVRLLPPGDNK